MSLSEDLKMANARVLNRTITKADHPWLENDIERGKLVYLYRDYTYGCISPSGTAVSLKWREDPFFEVPTDALDIP